MIESMKIPLAGKTETGPAESQPSRDSPLKGTNCRWGGSYTPAAPFSQARPIQYLPKVEKLLTVTWNRPIHAESVQSEIKKIRL
ncbi:MAG: hypothetical protein J7K65_07285 [Planctomycetes bacterium]|nr:hypothetical protein [Planctomycetota bacterium]